MITLLLSQDAEGSDAVPFDDDATEAFDGIVEEIQKVRSIPGSHRAENLGTVPQKGRCGIKQLQDIMSP